jgi:hypothetical protein
MVPSRRTADTDSSFANDFFVLIAKTACTRCEVSHIVSVMYMATLAWLVVVAWVML